MSKNTKTEELKPTPSTAATAGKEVKGADGSKWRESTTHQGRTIRSRVDVRGR
ncbi:MAG: hypothetical protein ACXIUZ_01980 [Lysobacteraceae bacterium]